VAHGIWEPTKVHLQFLYWIHHRLLLLIFVFSKIKVVDLFLKEYLKIVC
jgi:hypothetical protein